MILKVKQIKGALPYELRVGIFFTAYADKFKHRGIALRYAGGGEDFLGHFSDFDIKRYDVVQLVERSDNLNPLLFPV